MTDDVTPETPVDTPGRKLFGAKSELNRIKRERLDDEQRKALDEAFAAVERLSETLEA